MYIRVNAVPGSKKESVTKLAPDRYEIRVKERAEQNMANNRIMTVLAGELGVREASLRLISGHRGPHKIFSVPDSK